MFTRRGNGRTGMAKQAAEKSQDGTAKKLLKVVYFDEESASDYLDIATGGRAETSSEKVKTRSTELRATVVAKIKAGFSFLPGILSASAKVQGSFDASSAGQSVIRKTISNTILTDYLVRVDGDQRIVRLEGINVSAAPDSMTHMKMYTPLTTIMRTEESGIDIAKLDDAFVAAKGYYELVGSEGGVDKYILRFNFGSFRNNYRLTDLPQMALVFHGVHVGEARPDQLGLDAVMNKRPDLLPNADELLSQGQQSGRASLPVYDILLAGVQHGG